MPPLKETMTDEIQQRIPRRWQSLEELADSQEFLAFVENEFPSVTMDFRNNKVDRRQFVMLMAASLGLAGLTSCSPTPSDKIVPFVKPPEETIPGKPLFFATAMPMRGYGVGLIARSHQGRPTKVEGNPGHPASLGASDVFAQASVLGLYDPDRSATVKYQDKASTWPAFIEAVTAQMQELNARKGAGLRILTETATSPTLVWQIRELLKKYPQAAWHQYEPIGLDSSRIASRQLFGRYVDTRYNFEKATIILSLEADFLGSLPGNLRYSKEFSRRRTPETGGSGMNRLYLFENSPTITGAMADHKLAVRSSDIPALAAAIASAVQGRPFELPAEARSVTRHWIEVLAKDLREHAGSSLVLAGPSQPAEVHILAHRINAALGNVGKTVEYLPAVEPVPVESMQSLGSLVQELKSGTVDSLWILGGNPVYTAPADFEFGKHLLKAKFRVHLSLYDDETSQLCSWHIPEAHYLEGWSDVRAFDGTATIVQPIIDPIYNGRTAHEVVAAVLGDTNHSALDIVKGYWRQAYSGTDFERFWRTSLHAGKVDETPAAKKPEAVVEVAKGKELPLPTAPSGVELVFRPDPSILDGRYANNSWLQELPKSLSKVTWDNIVQLSPATAKELALENENVVEIRYDGRSVKGPVWITPGHADKSVTVFLGYGRTRAGSVGSDRGYNAYSIRTSTAPWYATNVEIRKTSAKYEIASTQHHHAMENRQAVRAGTLADYLKNPTLAGKESERPPSALTLYPEHASEDYAWGMSIDLSACNGCNACVVACQSENNIPVVGKPEVLRSREMHWMRIDRYYEGGEDNPETLFQPMLCQHCENAPCEPVCPVGATTHSAEGLNEMTYNRCVGTRYCSNNCPYKVRRFNFFQYAPIDVPSLRLLDNPDVTVRSRGVMEKCTFCVQRINVARIEAKNEGRKIRDGEVISACQSSCPADAIVFGNIKDPESRVSKLKAQERDYSVLAELNTRPRTTYLGKVTNPNPELVKG